jgi:predicted O-methyltransferase YrrM
MPTVPYLEEITMNREFQDVLARYELRAAREREIWEPLQPSAFSARRDEFLLHVGEEVARFLHALVIARGAKRLVELGTSYGYSTLFLADAARTTGGTLMTFELDAAKQRHARQEIEAAGLGASVEWHLGDATQLLKKLEGPIDFVLIDLWKDLYVPCFELLYPKLRENAVLAADNMLEPRYVRADAEAYRAAVRSKGDLHSVLLPIGNGIELSCLWRGPPP